MRKSCCKLEHSTRTLQLPATPLLHQTVQRKNSAPERHMYPASACCEHPAGSKTSPCSELQGQPTGSAACSGHCPASTAARLNPAPVVSCASPSGIGSQSSGVFTNCIAHPASRDLDEQIDLLAGRVRIPALINVLVVVRARRCQSDMRQGATCREHLEQGHNMDCVVTCDSWNLKNGRRNRFETSTCLCPDPGHA